MEEERRVSLEPTLFRTLQCRVLLRQFYKPLQPHLKPNLLFQPIFVVFHLFT